MQTHIQPNVVYDDWCTYLLYDDALMVVQRLTTGACYELFLSLDWQL